MRTIIAAAILAFGVAAPALAADGRADCATVPGRETASASAIRSDLEGLGYRVDRVEAEHGCYEVRAVNESGLPIEAVYSQGSGELLRAQLR